MAMREIDDAVKKCSDNALTFRESDVVACLELLCGKIRELESELKEAKSDIRDLELYKCTGITN